MHLAAIDYMANNGDSFLHRARPLTKVVISFLFLISLVISNHLYKAAVLLVVTIILIFLSKVNIRQILHLAAYPLVFSLIFAFIRMQQSWVLGVLVLMKALGAALNMLLLLATTPYTDLFGLLSFFLPSVIVDVFLFTYRSLFILLEKLENMVKNIRLRGGIHPSRLFFNLKNLAGAVGVMTIHAFDMSERLYRIYSLRGYEGKIPIDNEWQPPSLADGLLFLFALIVLTGVLIPWNI